jgi:hypothetical protein
VLAGCGGAYQYDPLNSSGAPQRDWSRLIDGVDFQVDRYSDSEDVDQVFFFLTVANDSRVNVVVIDATLCGSSGSLTAQFGRNARGPTIPPKATLYVPCSWKLPESHGRLSDYLGSEISVTWHVTVGDKEQELRVELARSYVWLSDRQKGILLVMLGLIFWLLIGTSAFFVYFLPTILASKRRNPFAGYVGILNLLIGWTVVGWIACLIGVSHTKRDEQR